MIQPGKLQVHLCHKSTPTVSPSTLSMWKMKGPFFLPLPLCNSIVAPPPPQRVCTTMTSWSTHWSERTIISLIQWRTVGDFTSSALTNSTCQSKPSRFHEPNMDGRQVASIQLTETECGSSAQSCQADVIQKLNGAVVAVREREREIPHCITTLLSKLYYLGHSWLYGCQSYHTKKTATVLIWLCLHPHINTSKHRKG